MRAFACCQHASGGACALQEKAEEEGSPRSKPDPTLQKEADEDPQSALISNQQSLSCE